MAITCQQFDMDEETLKPVQAENRRLSRQAVTNLV